MHSYPAKWSEPDLHGISVLEQALKNQVREARDKSGRSDMPTLLIVDAQSVKNTDMAGSKRYDADKKVSGIEGHIGVDTQGMPHAIAVTKAEVTDRKVALQAMPPCKGSLESVQSVLADSRHVG